MSINTIINIVLVLVVISFLYIRLRPVTGLKTLKSDEFLNTMNKGLLIDVREPNEYKRGFIQGAVNMPLSQLQQHLGKIPKDKTVFLYCQSGMRSKSAANILSKNGYSNLVHLQGGINTWGGKLLQK